jgi:hypothetical protein
MAEDKDAVVPENLDTEVTTEVEQTEGTEQVTAQVANKYEEQARQQGWVPKDEWDGDPEDWTDAKEFVRRGELFSKISSQSGEIKEMKKAMAALVEHHNKVKETEFKRALEYLKQQKKAALEEGDADKLLQVDDAIDALKAEQSQTKQNEEKPAEKQVSPVFVNWVKANNWYLTDNNMRTFADEVGVGYFSRNQGSVSEQEVYEYVLGRVKKQFPEKFKRQGSGVPEVESGNGSSRGATKRDSFKLSEEEERVMKTFVRQGIMSKEQYIEDLRKVRGE